MKSSYFENLKSEVKEYFSILSDEIPEFLVPYIQTEAMQRIGKTGVYCGTDYTQLFHNKFFYSNLDHSVGVALILWHFTKDKKQTLAGLFHDIATPAFKHCIDFLHQDYMKQETTEELTTQLIRDSKEIMTLLEQDGIKIEEVNDYKIYPLADNPTPRVSADRLEYTLSGGFIFEEIWDLKMIREIYDTIEIMENEDNILELGFKEEKLAEEYVVRTSKIWKAWISNKDKLTMQFLADIVKWMIKNQLLTQQELYHLSEQEVIRRIKEESNEMISSAFQKFEKSTQIGEGEIPVEDRYCVSITAKKRYTIPLVKTQRASIRIYEISSIAKEVIDEYLEHQLPKYAYLDFKIELGG